MGDHFEKFFLRAMNCFLQAFSTSSSILHSTLALSSISRLSMLLKMAFSSSVKLSIPLGSFLRLLVLTSSTFYCSPTDTLLVRGNSSFTSSLFLFFFFLFFFFFFLPDSSGSLSSFSSLSYSTLGLSCILSHLISDWP